MNKKKFEFSFEDDPELKLLMEEQEKLRKWYDTKCEPLIKKKKLEREKILNHKKDCN